MHTILNFLKSVLPESARHFCAVAIDPETGRPVQRDAHSHEALASLLKKITDHGFDAFFALSGFRQGYHDDPGGRLDSNGAVRKVFRTQANAYAMRALWLDLDVGDDPKKYPSQSAAVSGLVEFCNRTGMPRPYIVNSGGGIHVYWRFTEDISAAQWSSLSSALDAVVNHAGVLADPSRTMDAASILRPVGTVNRKKKYGPQGAAVTTVSGGDAADPHDVAVILSRYLETHKLTASSRGSASRASGAVPGGRISAMNNPAFYAVMGHVMGEAKDKDPVRIIQECQQVREAGLESEPVWFKALSVMKCCQNGEAAARVISAKDTRRFNEQQFIQKYRYVDSLPGGPATCDSFNRECPGKCVTCPHYGKITSPAELGRVPHNIMQPAPQPSVTTEQPAYVQPVSGVSLPASGGYVPVPEIDGFEHIEGKGIYRKKTVKGEDGSTETIRELVIDQCMYLVGKQEIPHSFTQMETAYIWNIVECNGRVRQAQMSADDQSSSAALSRWCMNNQLAVEPYMEVSRNNYLRSYIAKVQRKVPGVKLADQFGWTDAYSTEGAHTRGFNIGETLLLPGASPTRVALKATLDKFGRDRFVSKGSLEAWKQIPAFCHEHKILDWQIAICLSFGSVLLEFAPGSVQNGIVCFYGPSGSGKTTMLRIIDSIWGHPNRQMLRPQDTDNSQARISGLSRNTPTTVDEVTKLGPKEMSELVFALSEGREKHRLESKGALQSGNEWRKFSALTANHSICDILSPYLQARDAEVKRVLEIYVGLGDPNLVSEVRKMERLMERNYGLAGTYFVQRLLDTPELLDELPDRLDEVLSRFTQVQDERFWDVTIAVVVLGGRLAKEMGLVPFDMDAITEYMLHMRSTQRRTLVDAKSDGCSLLSDFLSDCLRDTLIVASKDREVKSNGDLPLSGDSYVLRHPPQTGNIDVRIEADTGTAYVRCAAFNNWCREHTIAPRNVLSELAVQGIYDATIDHGKGFTKMRLGRGVKAFTHVTPARVYVLALNDTVVDVQTLVRQPAEATE